MLSEDDKRRIESEESYRSEVRLRQVSLPTAPAEESVTGFKHPILWALGLTALSFLGVLLAAGSSSGPSPTSAHASDVKLVTTQDVVCAKTEEDLIRYFGAIKQQDLQVFTSMTEAGSGFTLLPGTTLTINSQSEYRSHVFVESGGHALTGCWAPTQMLK